MTHDSAGCRSRITEQVGSIISSINTMCTGRNMSAEGAIPSMEAEREARAMGIWMVKIYPTAFRILS